MLMGLIADTGLSIDHHNLRQLNLAEYLQLCIHLHCIARPRLISIPYVLIFKTSRLRLSRMKWHFDSPTKMDLPSLGTKQSESMRAIVAFEQISNVAIVIKPRKAPGHVITE